MVTFYLIAHLTHFILLFVPFFILTYIYIYIFSCVMFIYLFFLHFPLSGPVLSYISLLIIPCMIVYVTNNKEPWTYTLCKNKQKHMGYILLWHFVCRSTHNKLQERGCAIWWFLIMDDKNLSTICFWRNIVVSCFRTYSINYSSGAAVSICCNIQHDIQR